MKVLTTRARPRRRAAGLLVAGLLASTLVGCGPSGPPPGPLGRDVILVGNNVSGTVSFIDERTYDNLGSLDVVPDRVPAGTYAGRSRLARIPTQALWYLDPAPG